MSTLRFSQRQRNGRHPTARVAFTAQSAATLELPRADRAGEACARCSTMCSPSIRACGPTFSMIRTACGGTSAILYQRRPRHRSRSPQRSGRRRTTRSSCSRHCPADKRKDQYHERSSAGRHKEGSVRLAPDPRQHGRSLAQAFSAIRSPCCWRIPRDGTLYAAQALGHFGVKLQRSMDDGSTWQEVPAPAFPRAKPMGRACPTYSALRRVAPTSPDGSGAERSPAGCSCQAITVSPGR